MIRTADEFMEWITRVEPNAIVVLRADGERIKDSKRGWILGVTGLPAHIGAVRVEARSSAACAQQAVEYITGKIAARVRTAREDEIPMAQLPMELRCPRPDKTRFLNALEASRALASILATRRPGEKGPVTFYECRPCKGWHLTSDGRDDLDPLVRAPGSPQRTRSMIDKEETHE